MPTSAWPCASKSGARCARTCASWSCRRHSTAPARRAHLGGAPVAATGGCSRSGIEHLAAARPSRWSGGSRAPSSWRWAPVAGERARLPARRGRDRPRRGAARGAPGTPVVSPLHGDLPRAEQDAALRPGAGAAQGRARHHHRRDQPDHRGLARGRRRRPGAAAALRPAPA